MPFLESQSCNSGRRALSLLGERNIFLEIIKGSRILLSSFEFSGGMSCISDTAPKERNFQVRYRAGQAQAAAFPVAGTSESAALSSCAPCRCRSTAVMAREVEIPRSRKDLLQVNASAPAYMDWDIRHTPVQ